MPPLSKDLPLPEQAPLSWRQRLSDWLYHFVPTPIGINGRERLRVTAGIGLGILLAALLARWWSHGDTGPQPWMVASLGASAVLVGRPAVHGLAHAGAAGVAHVLRLLRDELEVAMALTGCKTLADAPAALSAD